MHVRNRMRPMRRCIKHAVFEFLGEVVVAHALTCGHMAARDGFQFRVRCSTCGWRPKKGAQPWGYRWSRKEKAWVFVSMELFAKHREAAQSSKAS